MSAYLQDLGQELSRPEVLLGLALFAAGVGVLYFCWKDRPTPIPFGVVLPF